MDRGKGCIKKRGKNSIGLEFSYKGERFRPTLKGLSADKKAHWKRAEEILLQIQADIASGNFNFAKYFPDHPKAKEFRKGADITIKEKLLDWLEGKRRTCEPTTYKSYKSPIEKHLLPQFGDLSLAELTPGRVRDWMYKLGITGKTVNNALTPLRGIFQEAFEDGLIDENPMARIRNMPQRLEEVDPFSPEEVRSILAQCEGQFLNYVKFAFATGLRTEELIGLKWEYVDLTRKIVHVRHVVTREGKKDFPKNSTSIRNVNLIPAAIEALQSQRQYTWGSEYVFHNPYTGEPWKRSDRIRRIWQRALKRAKVRYRKPYNTRHTYASTMLSFGINPMRVASQMGHKDWGMIRKIYGRYLDDADKGVTEKMHQFMTQDCQAMVQVPKIIENVKDSNPVTPTI